MQPLRGCQRGWWPWNSSWLELWLLPGVRWIQQGWGKGRSTVSHMWEMGRWIQYQCSKMITNHCWAVLTLGMTNCREEVLTNQLEASSQKPDEQEVSRHSWSLKSSKEKYDTHLETESEDDEQSAHERHVYYCRALDSGMDTDSSVKRHAKSQGNRMK